MRLQRINTIALVASVLFLFAEGALLFFTPRTETLQLLTVYGAMCGAYLVLYREVKSIRTAAFLGVLFRSIAWLAFPELSDDIYRFIWDGSVVLAGDNPFLYTPTEYFSSHVQVPFEGLYPLLNSSSYYSVYPPLMQGFMAFGALAANDHYLAALIIKLPLLLAEIATIWMLPQVLMRFNISPKYSVLYFLNPLIIVDVLANAHFEVLTVCLIVFALQSLQLKQFIQAGISIGLAIGIKLVPIILVPYLLKSLRGSSMILFGSGMLITLSLVFIPLFDTVIIQHFWSSLELYFQSFEFNASVYYLLRWIGFAVTGYNTIHILGPLLGAMSLGIGLYLYVKQPSSDLKAALNASFWAIAFYLFLTTTVHPWYLSTLLILGLFIRRRFPVIWSVVIILSYAAYRADGFEEHLWLVALEYGIVAFAIYKPKLVKRLFTLSPLRS